MLPEDQLFQSLLSGFERADREGTVQIESTMPMFNFGVRVKRDDLTYLPGQVCDPTATIIMNNNLAEKLILERDRFDTRVVDYSSRLEIKGDVRFGHAVLNLVKSPSSTALKLLQQSKDKNAQRNLLKLDVIADSAPSAIEMCMQNFTPAILRGALEEWHVENWHTELLRDKFGNAKIASYMPESLSEFIGNLSADSLDKIIYTHGVGLPGVFWKWFPIPPLLQKVASLGFPQLWMGRSPSETKTVTELHCDCSHVFLCHVFGRKSFYLYSPNQEEFLYPFKAFNFYRPCWTGPDSSSLDQFPKFKYAQPLLVDLKAGDILFIPAGWYHCAFASTAVMSISIPVIH